MKVYLIGMPGSGKTTFGKELAAALQMPFIDLDEAIEKKEGKSVQAIFAEEGEEHFRKAESERLRHWALTKENFVMSTGGGAPCFFDGMKIINDTGVSIFLDIPVEELMKRLEHDDQRPLLQSNDRFEKLTMLRDKRLPVYSQASFRFSEAPVVEQVLKKLFPQRKA